MPNIVELNIVDKEGKEQPTLINVDHVVYVRPFYSGKENTSAVIFTKDKMFVTSEIYAEVRQILQVNSLSKLV
tara:strand:+ start:532 stop:750 length:219 start_codon:yes stop_codon:yes gene_type:complete